MDNALLYNISEAKKLIELIQGDNVQLKADMTSKVLGQVKILNNAVPDLLNGLSDLGKLEKVKALNDTKYLYIKKQDKSRYIKQKRLIKKLRVADSNEKPMKGGNPYVKLSAKLFEKTSRKLLSHVEDLTDDLKAANIPMVTTTYLSLMFFTSLLSLIAGGALFAFLRGTYIWAILVLPLVSIILFYTYPSSKASEIDRKINFEIPFATIHMGTLAGSNIGPVRLFKIIGNSEEYPFLGFELKKVLNQVVVFGYNVTNALKNVSRRTKNAKLAELLEGISTNLSTGGELKTYLQKKSDSFLVDYKLERRKYIDLAGTFLDIYIAVLIAAPLIFILVLIIMNLIGFTIGGLGLTEMMSASVVLISILNIIFLIILNMKQPEI